MLSLIFLSCLIIGRDKPARCNTECGFAFFKADSRYGFAAFRCGSAFLKSSTPDGEIPTDHAINAVLFEIAVEQRIKYIKN